MNVTNDQTEESLFGTTPADQGTQATTQAPLDQTPESVPAPDGDLASDHPSPAVVSQIDDPPPAELTDLKGILESLLFVSPDPVPIERLSATVGSVPKAAIQEALAALAADLERGGGGLQLVEVAGGFQLTTRPEYGAWIRAFGKSKAAPKLSRSGLESLAIIAYKQPIVRADIEAIRGVETSAVIRTLLERKLVRIVGRKDVPGRPIMYGTTKFFLQHFGLRDLSELPPLREFKELGESEQALLPVGDEPLQIAEQLSESATEESAAVASAAPYSEGGSDSASS